MTMRGFTGNSFMLLLACLATTLLLVNGATKHTDIEVLRNLYVDTGGGNWSYDNLPGKEWVFDPASDPCGGSWKGITCNNTAAVCNASMCAVVGIYLPACNMIGEIPGWLGDIESLQTVVFVGNSLSGRFPNSLYRLSGITTIDMIRNNIQGVISSDIKYATSLITLRLDSNRLSGLLPESIGQATNLEEFTVSNSRFNGTIPASMGNLVKMKKLNMNGCTLFGSIPSSLGSMPQLTAMYLTNNSLTGSIPPEIFTISTLQFLSFAGNSLSKSIPSFQMLTELRGLALGNNRLTGAIPRDIYNAAELLILDLNDNRIGDNVKGLEKSIPEEIFSLTKLYYLFLGNNRLHGGLSENVGNFSQLRIFDISKNHIGGPIPEGLYDVTTLSELFIDQAGMTGVISPSIGKMKALNQLSIADNSFSSTLPSSIVQLSSLVIFTAKRNSFTGRIDHIFSENNIALKLIDISENALTGTLHPGFFQLPSLTTVSLMGNCFRGSISEQICKSNSLQLLLLDGLHSGSACRLDEYDLFNAFPTYTSKNMDGGIPGCLFGMANLSTLHLSGNGFYGGLDGSLLRPNSKLATLTLSHNRLTGTIPERIQRWGFKELDLQYNRFSGTLDNMDDVDQDMRLKLEHNRLSGGLTDSINTIRGAEILDGNLFYCKDKSELPDSDPLRDTYACGSSELDTTIYTVSFLGLGFGLVIIIWGVLIFLNRHYDNVWPAVRRFADYLSDRYNYFTRCIDKIAQLHHPSVMRDIGDGDIRSSGSANINCSRNSSFGLDSYRASNDNIPNLWLFVNTLIEMTRWKFYVMLTVLFVFMPIYISFKEVNTYMYSTHQHQYWYVSCALFLRGTTPSVVMFSVWFVLVAAMTFFSYGRHSSIRDNPFYRKLRRIKKSMMGKMVLLSNRMLFLLILMLVGNLLVVFLANGVYVYTTLTDVDTSVKTLAEITLAGFQLFWNATVVPKSIEWLTRMWSASFDDKIWLNIVVLIFNSVAAPCLISAVTDIDCFQYAFFKSPVIQSGYSFYSCEVFDLENPDSCLYESEIKAHTEFVPPFVYNYNCTSSLIQNFIPVFMYKFIYIAFIDPVVFTAVCSIESSRVPNWIRSMMPGILWPKESHATTPQRIFKPARILCQNLSYLSILLTFGIMCPPLAVLIFLACCVTCIKWQILLGRYLLSFENTNDRSISAVGRSIDWLSVLDIRCNFIWRGPWMVHWAVLWTSSIFFSFYFLDITSDEVGVPESLWVGTLPLLAALFIWFGWLCWRHMYPFVSELADVRGGSLASSVNNISTELQSTHVNILHKAFEMDYDDDVSAVALEQEMVNISPESKKLKKETTPRDA